jgi:hypothetical protein
MQAYIFLRLQVSHSLGVHGQGAKMNSETCLKTVKGLKERFNRVCLGKKPMFLQHDDARPHFCGDTGHRIRRCSTHSLQPALAPTDFWLFAALKKPLKGIHVTFDEEVQAVTGKWFREQPQETYTDGFEKLVQRWRRCIERERNFVEKCSTGTNCAF